MKEKNIAEKQEMQKKAEKEASVKESDFIKEIRQEIIREPIPETKEPLEPLLDIGLEIKKETAEEAKKPEARIKKFQMTSTMYA